MKRLMVFLTAVLLSFTMFFCGEQKADQKQKETKQEVGQAAEVDTLVSAADSVAADTTLPPPPPPK